MASISSWIYDKLLRGNYTFSQDEEFLTDTEMILGPQVEYDPQVAWEMVKAELVERLILR